MTTETIIIDKYIAISPSGFGGYYGTGATIEEAKVNLKKNYGNLNKVIIYRLPEGVHSAYVNDFGGISWKFTSEELAIAWRNLTADEQELEVVHRRGVPLPTKEN